MSFSCAKKNKFYLDTESLETIKTSFETSSGSELSLSNSSREVFGRKTLSNSLQLFSSGRDGSTCFSSSGRDLDTKETSIGVTNVESLDLSTLSKLGSSLSENTGTGSVFNIDLTTESVTEDLESSELGRVSSSTFKSENILTLAGNVLNTRFTTIVFRGGQVQLTSGKVEVGFSQVLENFMVNTSTDKGNVILSEKFLGISLDSLIVDTGCGLSKDGVTKTGTESNLMSVFNSTDLSSGESIGRFSSSLVCNIVEFMLLILLLRDNIT